MGMMQSEAIMRVGLVSETKQSGPCFSFAGIQLSNALPQSREGDSSLGILQIFGDAAVSDSVASVPLYYRALFPLIFFLSLYKTHQKPITQAVGTIASEMDINKIIFHHHYHQYQLS